MKPSLYGVFIWVLVAVASGCTRMPPDYNSNPQKIAATGHHNDVMQLVASARVGVPQTHVDIVTGLASEVTVKTEYFSANGRSCRRFTQHMSNAQRSVQKLGCKDQRHGWREIPVASIVE